MVQNKYHACIIYASYARNGKPLTLSAAAELLHIIYLYFMRYFLYITFRSSRCDKSQNYLQTVARTLIQKIMLGFKNVREIHLIKAKIDQYS